VEDSAAVFLTYDVSWKGLALICPTPRAREADHETLAKITHESNGLTAGTGEKMRVLTKHTIDWNPI